MLKFGVEIVTNAPHMSLICRPSGMINEAQSIVVESAS